MTMKQRVTAFLNRWSPWRLRKVIRNLENNFKEKEALATKNTDLEAENERLEKENEKLRSEKKMILGSAVKNALVLKSRVIDFIEYFTDQAKGETE